MKRCHSLRAIQPLGILAILGTLSAHAAVVGWVVSALAHIGIAGLLATGEHSDFEAVRIAGGKTSAAIEIVVTLPPSPAPMLVIESPLEPSATPVEAGSISPAPESSMPLLDALAMERSVDSQATAPRRSVDAAPQERFARAAPRQNASRRTMQSAEIKQYAEVTAPAIERQLSEPRPLTPVTVASLPVVLGTVVDDVAKPIYNPQPVYPASALASRIEGRVMLKLAINSVGNVVEVNVVQSSNSTALDQAALSAVKLWRFEPARRNGIPVAWECRLPVRFSIGD